MTAKKITIKPILELRNAQKNIDEWVNSDTSLKSLQNDKKTSEDYRFTVVIPAHLHRRIKKYCVIQGITIKDKFIEIFEKEFPET